MPKGIKEEKPSYKFVDRRSAKVGDVIKFTEDGKKEYPAKVFDKQNGSLLIKVIGMNGANTRIIKI